MLKVLNQPNINVLALSHAWQNDPTFHKYKKKGHFAVFLLEALSRSPLPTFSYGGKKHPMQKHRQWYGDFATDLKQYYNVHKKDVRAGLAVRNIEEAKKFPSQLRELVVSFGNYKLPCNKIILSPNVFGVSGEGYGPKIGKTAYAVFMPNPKKDQTWLMVHEVCHSLLLPVFESKKVRRLIKKTEPLLETWSTAGFRKYYPKWEWVIEENLIHAIEQYVTGTSLKEKESWGMKRIGWFAKSWAAFQKEMRVNPKLSVEDWVAETLEEIAN